MTLGPYLLWRVVQASHSQILHLPLYYLPRIVLEK